MLQRSRGVIAAERAKLEAGEYKLAIASTEPRRDRRGEVGCPFHGDDEWRLQRSRGVIAAESPDEVFVRVQCLLLQRSRGVIAAESRRNTGAPDALRWLQRSRGVIAGEERAAPRRVEWDLPRFNGAAA